MATEAEIMTTIILPLRANFEPRKSEADDPRAYASAIAQWIAALEDYTADELCHAYQRFLLAWKPRGWPSPAYMRELAHQVRQEIAPRIAHQRPREPEIPTSKRQRMAYQLGQWRLWMEGRAPKNTYPTHPRFSPEAQADWLLHESASEPERRKLADMIAEVVI